LPVNEFVEILLNLPPETNILTEAVHGSSQTIDSRHFAEEFIRRKKLADKGIVDSSATSTPAANTSGSSGGWNEVAKKGPAQQKEETNSFKVVPAKKKGGKR
jgi:PERQ amino acid-rich with GYF domain-containing protein